MPHEVRRRVRRGACLTVTAALACAAPAAAQDATGGASPEPAPTAAPPAAAPETTAAAPETTTTAPAPRVQTLRRGSRGAAVRGLQRKLRITADGVYGRQTARAVRRWQARNDIRATGVAGPATLRALGLVPAAPAAALTAVEVPAILARIAECESGGDPTAISRGGTYRGKYQFDRPTWRSVGGSGDPAAAPEAEQDQRAAQLYAQRGVQPWPVCGRRATQAA